MPGKCLGASPLEKNGHCQLLPPYLIFAPAVTHKGLNRDSEVTIWGAEVMFVKKSIDWFSASKLREGGPQSLGLY